MRQVTESNDKAIAELQTYSEQMETVRQRSPAALPLCARRGVPDAECTSGARSARRAGHAGSTPTQDATHAIARDALRRTAAPNCAAFRSPRRQRISSSS